MSPMAMQVRPDLYASAIAPMVRYYQRQGGEAASDAANGDAGETRSLCIFLYYIGRKIHLMHRDQRTHSSHHFARPSFVPAAGRKFRKSTASLPVDIATIGLSER